MANDEFYSDLEVINKMLDGNLAVKGEKLGSMYSFRYGGLSSETDIRYFMGKMVNYGIRRSETYGTGEKRIYLPGSFRRI